MQGRTHFSLLLLLMACHSGDPPHDAAAERDLPDTLPDAPAPPAWSFDILDTRPISVGTASFDVQLIRANRPDGERTYLLYVPGPNPGAPLFVFNQPYAGIDWTGEEVDERWAELGNGVHPDVEAPEYDGDDLIGYEALSVQAALEQTVVPLLNEFALVHVFGRFYAGGSLEDDIRDASAPYHFALSRPSEIDAARIGSFGGSWGAMMALFGASRAPAEVTARAVAASSPPSDFADLTEWATERGPSVWRDPPQLEAFYSPYLRRIRASLAEPASAPGAFSRYQPAALCEGLARVPEDSVWVFHDQWDILVPVIETETLDETCPRVIQPMYWPRDGEPDYETAAFDHGPFTSEPQLPTLFTLSYLHLALELKPADATVLTAGARAALEATLSLLAESQSRGEDVSYATAPLRAICDPRATYFDADTTTVRPGANLLSESLNAAIGTSTTPADVCDALADGLPSL